MVCKAEGKMTLLDQINQLLTGYALGIGILVVMLLAGILWEIREAGK